MRYSNSHHGCRIPFKDSVCIARITPNPKGAKDFVRRSTNDDLPTEALRILHTLYGGWVEPTLHTWARGCSFTQGGIRAGEAEEPFPEL